MENVSNELMDIDTEQQTIDNEREQERRCNQVSNSAQRDARLESDQRLRFREMRARESDAERSTRL